MTTGQQIHRIGWVAFRQMMKKECAGMPADCFHSLVGFYLVQYLRFLGRRARV